MAALPSRESLESLKRADLQKICKDYGVKANLKSEALIDLLLDTQKPLSKAAPMRRTISTRISNRAGPSRISSVIIHEMNEEDIEEEQQVVGEGLSQSSSNGHGPITRLPIEQEELRPPMTRTRKAKEQTRLGVGRPVAAGGPGPRLVTKSMSISKPTRGKGSKSVKPSEATILEEDLNHDTLTETAQDPQHTPNISSRQIQSNNINTEDAFSSHTLSSLEAIDKHVADALRPLHEQMESLKTELELVQALRTELEQLKNEVENIETLKQRVEALAAEVVELRIQAASAARTRTEFRQWGDAMKPNKNITFASTPVHPQRSQLETQLITYPEHGPEPSSSLAGSSTITHPHHSTTPTSLGKRVRDSLVDDTIEDQEIDNLESDPVWEAIKPIRKRPKISRDDEGTKTAVSLQNVPSPEENDSTTSVPGFAVFNDQDEPSEQFPADRLVPSLLSSESGRGATVPGTDPPSENHQAFRFSFLPSSSTPAHTMFMPSFPYPEPPQSPSPAGSSTLGFLNDKGDRTDVFQTFGLPSPIRPPRPSTLRAAGPRSQYVDPAELVSEEYSKHDEGAPKIDKIMAQSKREPTASSSGSGSSSSTLEMKRTMYGTELDGDTRFGDFGVEGVGTGGTGFWAGGRY